MLKTAALVALTTLSRPPAKSTCSGLNTTPTLSLMRALAQGSGSVMPAGSMGLPGGGAEGSSAVLPAAGSMGLPGRGAEGSSAVLPAGSMGLPGGGAEGSATVLESVGGRPCDKWERVLRVSADRRLSCRV